eukprot:3012840-Amphidinium_carterae.1
MSLRSELKITPYYERQMLFVSLPTRSKLLTTSEHDVSSVHACQLLVVVFMRRQTPFIADQIVLSE